MHPQPSRRRTSQRWSSRKAMGFMDFKGDFQKGFMDYLMILWLWYFMIFHGIHIYIYSWDSYISIMVLDYVVDFCIPWWAIMIHGDMAYGMVIFCPWCYGISEHRDVPPRDRQPTYSNSDLLWPAKIGMYPIKREDLIFVFQQCGLSG